MKRGITAILIILTILYAGFPSTINPSFALSSGDSFIYELTSAILYARAADDVKSVSGYYDDNVYHPPGSKINTTIRYISEFGTMFDFNIRNYTDALFVTPEWFDHFILKRTYVTLYYAFRMIANFHEIDMFDINMFEIRPMVYLNASDFLSTPNSFENAISNIVDGWFTGEDNIEYLFTRSENDGIIYFESWIGGEINEPCGSSITVLGKDYSTDITFGNGFHIAVNTTSDIVYGWGQRGWAEGRIDNKRIRISMDRQFELEGYAFPEYQFGEMKYFKKLNLETLVFLPASLLIISTPAIVYFIRKRDLDKLLKAQAEKQDNN